MRPSKQELVDMAEMLANSPTRISFLRTAAEFWVVTPEVVRNWYRRYQMPLPGVARKRLAFVPDLADLVWAWNASSPAPSRADLLERVAAYYGVCRGTVEAWASQFQGQVPMLRGPRGPYKKD